MGTAFVIPAAVKVLAFAAALLGILKGGAELDKLLIKKDRRRIHEKAKEWLKKLDAIQVKDFLKITCGWFDDFFSKSKRHYILSAGLYIFTIIFCIIIGNQFFGLFENREGESSTPEDFVHMTGESEYSKEVSALVLLPFDVLSVYLTLRLVKLLKSSNAKRALFYLALYSTTFFTVVVCCQGALFYGLYKVRDFEIEVFTDDYFKNLTVKDWLFNHSEYKRAESGREGDEPIISKACEIQCVPLSNETNVLFEYSKHKVIYNSDTRLIPPSKFPVQNYIPNFKRLSFIGCLNNSFLAFYLCLFNQQPIIMIPIAENDAIESSHDVYYSVIYTQKISLLNYLFAGSVTIPVLLLLLYLSFLFVFKYIAMVAKFIPWVIVRKIEEDEKEVEPFKLIAIVADVMILMIEGIRQTLEHLL